MAKADGVTSKASSMSLDGIVGMLKPLIGTTMN